MVGLIIFSLGFLWISYEVWRAPHLDDKGNVIKPTKKFKDIFKW